MSALSEAQAVVAELEAKRSALAEQIKAIEAERAPVVAKVSANHKRRAKQPIIASLAGTVHLMTRASISPQVDYYRGEVKPKALLDALASGGIKLGVGGGYGASYTAKGLPGRVRVPDPATVRAWKRATAARERAEKAARDARAAELAAAAAAFAAGTKITLDELLPDLALTAKLKVAERALPTVYEAKHELDRLMADDDWGAMRVAKRHLGHLRKRDEDTGCMVCQRMAREKREADERKARIMALARQKATCPEHKVVKIGYTERLRSARVRLDPNGEPEWVENFPVWYCPVDFRQYNNTSLFLAEREKAAKAKPAKGMTYICPNPECGETVTSPVISDQERTWVECPVCESEWAADAVKRVKAAA